ncbi:DoxX family protein [Terriglobus roseus]|uniref:DoxX-like family protein n=1 Tax=Terriglobus roseus TaxID=392734 RepID=A0A1H4MT47_9BACT|nr:DoxX family protein [Terriglobus roseus]SEB85828.1 DoxX-like family protein [Terriglobus roseus]
MTTEDQPSKPMLWIGWILTALPALFLLSGGVTAALQLPVVKEGLGKYGFTPSILPIFAAVELTCAVLTLIPRTAPIGAILISAYMGGAVITHLRAGEAQWFIPVIFSAVVWIGLWLRRPSLRQQMLGI